MSTHYLPSPYLPLFSASKCTLPLSQDSLILHLLCPLYVTQRFSPQRVPSISPLFPIPFQIPAHGINPQNPFKRPQDQRMNLTQPDLRAFTVSETYEVQFPKRVYSYLG